MIYNTAINITDCLFDGNVAGTRLLNDSKGGAIYSYFILIDKSKRNL